MAVIIRGQQFKNEKEAGAILGIDPLLLRREITGPVENRMFCDESDGWIEEAPEVQPEEKKKRRKHQQTDKVTQLLKRIEELKIDAINSTRKL